MNGIEFLIKEHNRVRAMLADISDNSHQYETKKKMFDVLSRDLIRHENMEHEVWYPHLRNKLSSTVQHLLTEEKGAEKAIQKLEGLSSQEAWEANFLKFKEAVEHHAKEEEHDLFPEAQKILSNQELEEIGLKMYEFKKTHS